MPIGELGFAFAVVFLIAVSIFLLEKIFPPPKEEILETEKRNYEEMSERFRLEERRISEDNAWIGKIHRSLTKRRKKE